MKNDFNNTSSSEQEQAKPAQNDSLLGCLLFDAFCGGALGELATEAMDVPQWARSLDVDPVIDLYEEYRQDRANGGYELGVSGTLNGTFNGHGLTVEDQKAGHSSLPVSEMAAKGQGSFVTAPALAR